MAPRNRQLPADIGRYTESTTWKLHVRRPRARVLLVEDDQNIRELVELHLQLEGLTVVSNGDGNEALALARTEPSS